TLWEMARHAGVKPVATIPLRPAAPDKPDLMYVEEAEDGGFVRLRAVSSIGFLNWNEYAGLARGERYHEWMLDNQGAALLWGGDATHSAIVSVGAAKETRLWRYEVASPADGAWAMNFDGTLFIVEKPAGRHAHVTALDGNTGVLKFRVQVPHVF